MTSEESFSSSASSSSVDGLMSSLRSAASQEKAFIRPTQFFISPPSSTNQAKSTTTSESSISADNNSYTLTGWKTQEFAYRLNSGLDSRLPTFARGLFTTTVDPKPGLPGHKSNLNQRDQVQDTGKREGAQDEAGERKEEEVVEKKLPENRIAVRGYDKFFNLDEMPWTSQASIEKYSTAPYLLTFKENGCIIFVSALSPTRLVVTSKNSLGKRPDLKDMDNRDEGDGDGEDYKSHATAGEEWLDRHLLKVNRTQRELAEELWGRNETAVFELCDDSFEEHVLAYSKQRSGLHLHGLNSNTSIFKTRHMSEVDAFAKEWGFIPTRWLTMNTMAELQTFTEDIAKTGCFEGEAIEGFVVRTHMPSRETTSVEEDAKAGKKKAVKPPYSEGQAWFYKIKFDEPYLMYREWRELTRKMLNLNKTYLEEKKQKEASALKALEGRFKGMRARGQEPPKEGSDEYQKIYKTVFKGLVIPNPPTPRSNRPETHVFVKWANDMLYGSAQNDFESSLKAQPEIFSEFHKTKGIIATREKFLEYLKTEEGRKRLSSFQVKFKTISFSAIRSRDDRPFQKTLLVPIAVLGCGKTSVSRALSKLFGWELEQSDAITAKRTGPTFLRKIDEALSKPLEESKVVIADRNNHLFSHREDLVELVAKYETPTSEPKKGKSSSSASAIEIPNGEKDGNSKGKGKTTLGGNQQSKTKVRGLKVRMIALCWKIQPPFNQIRQICLERIEKRGDNHQTVRFSDGKNACELLLDSFLKDFNVFQNVWDEGAEDSVDDGFDDSIYLNVEDDLETSITKVVEELIKMGVVEEKDRPSKSSMEEAIRFSQDFKIQPEEMRLNLEMQRLSMKEGPRYYGIKVDMDLGEVMDSIVEEVEDEEKKSELKKLLEVMRRERTFTAEPHVTLVHQESVAKEKKHQERIETSEVKENSAQVELESDFQGAIKRWDLISNVVKDRREKQIKSSPEETEKDLPISITLDLAAWNSRAISLKLSEIQCDDSEYFSLDKLQLHDKVLLHVTVGTTAMEIRGYEGARVLQNVESLRNGSQMESDTDEKPKWLELKKPLRFGGYLKGMR